MGHKLMKKRMITKQLWTKNYLAEELGNFIETLSKVKKDSEASGYVNIKVRLEKEYGYYDDCNAVIIVNGEILETDSEAQLRIKNEENMEKARILNLKEALVAMEKKWRDEHNGESC
jgi:hypothetical protein